MGPDAQGPEDGVIGLNQFTYALGGEPWVGGQAAIGAMLRVSLGLTLLHAAARRPGDEDRSVLHAIFGCTPKKPVYRKVR